MRQEHPPGTNFIQLHSPERGSVAVRPDNSVWLDKDGESYPLWRGPEAKSRKSKTNRPATDTGD